MHIYKGAPISIPQDLSLTELLHQSAGPAPLPESHLIAKDNLTNRSLTIGELRDRAGRLAKGLVDYYRPKDGDHWAILLPNCVEYIELFHALLWAGGVGCTINYALKAAEIGHALVVTRPSYIFTYGPSIPKIVEAIELASRELHTESISWAHPEIITVISKHSSYMHVPDDFLAPIRLPIPHYPDTRQRVASIHLSSGTTGTPKGVELTHYNFVANCLQLHAYDPAQFGSDMRQVAYTPFAHIGGTTVQIFMGPWAGMLHHAMPAYNLETFAQLVQSNRASNFQGVPGVVLALAGGDVTKRYDFSSARIMNVGGMPLRKEMQERFKKLAPWRFVQVYGMTEAAGYVAYQRLSDTSTEGSMRLLPGLEARLVKENSIDDAPEGGPGELWLRGPNITRGYVFNAEANRTAFPAHGWYNTGDVCTIETNGILKVVGRTKELIKSSGFQVAPAELETLVNSHRHVVEAGVGPIWDEHLVTELPTAYVVLKSSLGTKDERIKALKEIQSEIDGMVSGYKKLRGGVWEVLQLPKNTTGKILRGELKGRRTGLCSLERKDRRVKL
ncbi:AMP-binding enzyme [Patellaria atrata CBS 101060]|uniref:AMP-binding enzyme n=1 Tax=Patellaria atrata CBS 101060 TaxID=1346257 RepID=A0A9P4S748_9PEZI|nr:AMP-binding enzyme [Patellaria atrata CBS 101060]